jgi:hypothetical protein
MVRAQESATAALDYSDLTLSVVDGNTAVLSWKDNSRFEDGHTIMRYSYEYRSSRGRWRGKRLSRRRSVWRPEDETSLLLPTRRGHRLSSRWALRLRHEPTRSRPRASRCALLARRAQVSLEHQRAAGEEQQRGDHLDRQLEQRGFHVERSTNGAASLRRLRRAGFAPAPMVNFTAGMTSALCCHASRPIFLSSRVNRGSERRGSKIGSTLSQINWGARSS